MVRWVATSQELWLNEYMIGSIPPYIYADIGGVDRWIWFVSHSSPISIPDACPD
jgi:hypothetical protein